MSEIDFSGKKNQEAIGAYANMLDTEIIVETEEAPEGEYFED